MITQQRLLTLAIRGLEEEKRQVEAELKQFLSRHERPRQKQLLWPVDHGHKPKPRRKMSAAAKKAISVAMKKRWAQRRAGK